MTRLMMQLDDIGPLFFPSHSVAFLPEGAAVMRRGSIFPTQLWGIIVPVRERRLSCSPEKKHIHLVYLLPQIIVYAFLIYFHCLALVKLHKTQA